MRCAVPASTSARGCPPRDVARRRAGRTSTPRTDARPRATGFHPSSPKCSAGSSALLMERERSWKVAEASDDAAEVEEGADGFRGAGGGRSDAPLEISTPPRSPVSARATPMVYKAFAQKSSSSSSSAIPNASRPTAIALRRGRHRARTGRGCRARTPSSATPALRGPARPRAPDAKAPRADPASRSLPHHDFSLGGAFDVSATRSCARARPAARPPSRPHETGRFRGETESSDASLAKLERGRVKAFCGANE